MRRPERWRPRATCLAVPAAVAMLCAGTAAQAQDALDAALDSAAYTVVPRVTITETFIDNANPGANARSDQITEISPGIRMTRAHGRVRGYLDYALRGIAYAQNPRTDNYQQALSLAGDIEAVDQWLFVDVSGSISQQGLSAFGPLSIASDYGNQNTAEVSSFRVSPYVRGRLGGLADYIARLSRSTTGSDRGSALSVGQTQASIDLSGTSAQTALGWVASASRNSVDYSAGRKTEADLVNAGLTLNFTNQLSTTVRAGRESSNYQSTDKRDFVTSDVSLRWSPSPQTQASASWGKRSFGDTHSINLEHATPLWQLRFASQRDVSVTPGQVLPLLLRTPQGRPVIGLFATTALALQDRQDLSLTLLGKRDTLTLALSQSDNTRIDSLSQTADELARSAVHQRGASVQLNHRLTPRYSVTLLAAQQTASGAAGQSDARLNEASLSLEGKLSRSAQGTVALRRARYSGPSSYEQTSLAVSLNFTF